MWKVKCTEFEDRTVLSLSGRVQAEQLTDLQEVLASVDANQTLVLDLEDLRLVDQDTVTFLARCEAHGASLQNCPAYIRNWIGAAEAK